MSFGSWTYVKKHLKVAFMNARPTKKEESLSGEETYNASLE